MTRTLRLATIGIGGVWLACATSGLAQTTFEVRAGEGLSEGRSGRLVVYLIADTAKLRADTQPADGPFFEDPQPMFGVDVRGWNGRAPIVIDDSATSFPVVLSKLPPGKYAAQAVLDTQRLDSSWRREPGNFYSEIVPFEVAEKSAAGQKHAAITIELSRATEADAPEPIIVDGQTTVDTFEVRSELLSAFRGRDVMLRAGVVFPIGHDASRAYAAVYEVPGFGGNHRGAGGVGARRFRGEGPKGDARMLAESTFWIVLDPEGPNGHTLFADSANNGPCGRALVEELIPALEKKYNLMAKPEARLLRGHSSGGWSTLWLAVTYPQTFGACWSSAPDPVDFTRFQLPDIYARQNFYRLEMAEFPRPTRTAEIPDTPSYRSASGEVQMTNREENFMEEVMGPGNTSGQQWDSWFAAWGPRDAKGEPAALFDPATGAIDRAVAQQYRAYDLADLVRKNPGTLGPIFKQRIRLIVGDADNFYLNEAVALLKAEVDKLSFFVLPEGDHGFITIVPGLDHGSVFGHESIREMPTQMVEHLSRHALVK
jgi:Putative esterase